jgi:hypothetical protein
MAHGARQIGILLHALPFTRELQAEIVMGEHFVKKEAMKHGL